MPVVLASIENQPTWFFLTASLTGILSIILKCTNNCILHKELPGDIHEAHTQTQCNRCHLTSPKSSHERQIWSHRCRLTLIPWLPHYVLLVLAPWPTSAIFVAFALLLTGLTSQDWADVKPILNSYRALTRPSAPYTTMDIYVYRNGYIRI